MTTATQGRCLKKKKKKQFIFYRRISQIPTSVQHVYRSQNFLKLKMQCQRSISNKNTRRKPPSLTFSKRSSTSSFHVVVTAKKYTKNYNARVQLLFCSLNLLFCGVLVAVAAVVCLRSLLTFKRSHNANNAVMLIIHFELNA